MKAPNFRRSCDIHDLKYFFIMCKIDDIFMSCFEMVKEIYF